MPSGKGEDGEKERDCMGVDWGEKREGRVESVWSRALVRGLFLGPLLVDLTPAPNLQSGKTGPRCFPVAITPEITISLISMLCPNDFPHINHINFPRPFPEDDIFSCRFYEKKMEACYLVR